MAKTPAEIRLEKAQKKLSKSLKNLEEALLKKISENATEAKMIGIDEDDKHSHEALLAQQSAIIQSFGKEVNDLQKQLSNLGMENEFLNEKNKAAAQKISEIQRQTLEIVNDVELDLAQIEQLIIKN